MHHDSGYATVDKNDRDVLSDSLSEQPNSNSDLATFKEHVNEHCQYGEGEKSVLSARHVTLLITNFLYRFRYHVTLQAPTAMLWHVNESPATYLNKGQTYNITVVDSAPPTKKAGLFKYKTSVHVSFEMEDQSSNPVAPWQLWKEARGSKEAHEHKGEALGIEYVGPSRDDVSN